MSTTMTWGHGARRKALALLAASALLASLIIVFSPAAWGDHGGSHGNPPSVECASTDPEWDDEYYKVEINNGTLSTVETIVAGAIALDADGSWTNDNDDDSVFRIILKVDAGVDSQVLSGMWETGEGGTIDLTLNGLAHVTFCFTDEDSEEDDEDEDSEEPEPTTTTTTSESSTTTTSESSTTTTSESSTTTTSPDAWTATTPGESTTTPASDETTTNAAANSTEVSDSALASDPSQPNESTEADGSKTDGSEWHGPEGSLPDADRDTTVAGLIGGWGEPPALGQASVSSNAVPGVIPSSHQWPTQVDLAILGALIAAIAVLVHRRKLAFRRLVGKAHMGKRWR